MTRQLLARGEVLLRSGPLVQAEIHTDEISFLTNKNFNGYEPFARVNLMVDTGSNISGIDSSVVKKLRLRKYDESAEVEGVGGMHNAGRYRCIVFLDIFGMKGLPLDVIEGDYLNAPYQGVLGRDVLQFCRFVYDGPSSKFVLTAKDF
jgi:hypothetical protein